MASWARRQWLRRWQARQAARVIPENRPHPDELAAALFLASEESAFITGADMVVDHWGSSDFAATRIISADSPCNAGTQGDLTFPTQGCRQYPIGT